MEIFPLRTLCRSLTTSLSSPCFSNLAFTPQNVPRSAHSPLIVRRRTTSRSLVGKASRHSTRVKARRFSSFSLCTVMAQSIDVGKKGVELKVYDNGSELGQDLAAYVTRLSESAISERGAFSVVLSGGSLISTLGKLTEEPYVGKIDWSRWHVFWADERCVPLDHPDSNYKLAYDGLLSKVSIPSGQVYAINDKLSPQGAAEDYDFGLRQLVKSNIVAVAETGDYPRFDLILLGMGPDGHIASLFPHHPLVSKKEVWIASIEDSPKPPPERITFTLPVINSAANVAFVATGSGKADKLKQVFGPDLPFGELPAQLVAPYKGNLVWFADRDAVSKL